MSDNRDDQSGISNAEQDFEEDEELQDGSASDEDAPHTSSYQVLLHALNAKSEASEPTRKRRKLSNSSDVGGSAEVHISSTKAVDESPDSPPEGPQATLSDDAHQSDGDDEDYARASDEESGSSDSEDLLTDPFDTHYAKVEESLLSPQIEAVKGRKWQSAATTVSGNVRKSVMLPSSSTRGQMKSVKTSGCPSFKSKLSAAVTKIQASLVGSEHDLAASAFEYKDVLFGSRSLENSRRTQDLVSLHLLNHVFKTRDRVIKNNSKLAQEADQGNLDARDQGFTRPKVLLLLPTRQACVRWAESISRLSEPEQQENKARFVENYSADDNEAWDEKPEDFQDTFAGNIDDDFRIGMKFTRKTVKFFSSFYNSDIILASALGLMRAIEGTDSKDKKKDHDADFLSSIEIAIVDHANAILMQNWQHVEYIFSQLNLLPKESHGCDFSRVRNWCLDGNAKYLRQTIILSDYLAPEINSLASTYFHNVAGMVKYTPIYPGAMLNLPPFIPPGTVTQTFTRFPSPTPASDHDTRFTHFTTTILPTLLRHPAAAKGTLVFLPDYPSFLRLRNHLSTSLATASLSFAAISEYSSHRDVARARSHFLSGRHSVLLYTERAHHFRRFRLRGVKRVVFYGVPENPVFWSEIVGFVGLDVESTGESKSGKGVVRALFSKWDVMKLERIVGTERVGRLVSEGKGGDVFDFV